MAAAKKFEERQDCDDAPASSSSDNSLFLITLPIVILSFCKGVLSLVHFDCDEVDTTRIERQIFRDSP